MALKKDLEHQEILRGFREECDQISKSIVTYKSQAEVLAEIQQCEAEIQSLK